MGKKQPSLESDRASQIDQALRAVERLRKEALQLEGKFAETLQGTAPALRNSACNLMHYLAVRHNDIRNLQRDLGKLGLSSLGRMEAHVLTSLNDVAQALCLIGKRPVPEDLKQAPPITFDSGDAILATHADAILGPVPADRKTRVMVTMPSEAAGDPAYIADLLAQGMNIMRINCAHDSPDVWARMIKHLRLAEKKLGLSCRISFDLAGPKLRTGGIETGECVVKWRPARNALGQVIAPAVVSFVREAPADAAAAVGVTIPIQGKLLGKARVGDCMVLTDTRGRVRSLEVVEAGPDACVCHADRAAYVIPGIELKLRRKDRTVGKAQIGDLPPLQQAIPLKPGDILEIARGNILGRPALLDDAGKVTRHALIGCSLTEVFRNVRKGERIFFDDGRISGVILGVTYNRIRVQISSAVGGTAKLLGEKGINLPDSDLKLPAMTVKDREDLVFAVRHADMVAMSFVQRVEDVEELIAALDRLQAGQLGIVLKIETHEAFKRLPSLLLSAMRHYPVAVMVARGDLGVEVGFERLSEVQEEILWLCEAAHVPVIWATQVLESLAKGGMPSRAEVTDAAMGTGAECVMLNKGPYILQTMEFLCDVLNRMEAHHNKKTAMLRKLSISDLRKPRDQQ
ncbi:MAG: pyruvate kinase [Proteobacteria bacterium]|nr:pyruvate kinase [Pseudomonadota bacterium]